MFKTLSYFQKFLPGSHLWLIFFEPKRDLFKQINWRTGFLLQSLNGKQPVSHPVLVDTQKIFPNKSLLCLPFKKEFWVADVYNSWKQLDKPSFRIFIPSAQNGKQLYEYWPQQDQSHNLSYYEESAK